MKILVLTYEYPPIGGGGGRVAQDLCQGLAARGHEVQVLTAHHRGLPFEQRQGDVLVRRLVSGRKQAFKAGLGAMAGYVAAAVWHGTALTRRWKPDVIHTHFAVPSGAAAWAVSKLTGVPYLLTAHLGDVPGGVPEKTGRWFRFIYPFTPPIWKGAAAIAAVSGHTQRLAQQSYPVRVQVIPNGVDLRLLDPGLIALNDPPRIVFAGRFQPQKNPLQIVRTLSALRDLPWQCDLIGDGPLRPAVEAEIAACGLGARIHLPGWVAPEEVLDWYRRSDILFMPSLTEGLPVAGVQALALGLALVVGRAGGFVDLVDEGRNGFLSDASAPAGFERGLRQLLSDPAGLLAARQASREIARRFDLDKVVDAYEQLLQSLQAIPNAPHR